MENEETSKLLSEKVDIKRSRIISFANMIKNMSENGKLLSEDTSVALLTSLGIVNGKIFIPEMITEETKDDLSLELQVNIGCLDAVLPFVAFLEKSVAEEGLNPRPVNDTSLIVIEDAVLITPSGTSHNFKILNLFVDQVIGFSFGSFQANHK